MARRAFYSFHYAPDAWRASTVRNIGAIEGNRPATDNDWEAVKRGGDDAIKRWIADHPADAEQLLADLSTVNSRDSQH